MAEPTDISQDFSLPPASFEFLVESVLMQTQMQLGLLQFDDKDEEPEPNLVLAKHSIDMLAVIQEKTRGNLTPAEQRLIENGLTELRFRYVQIAEELQRHGSPLAAADPNDADENRPRIIMADGGKGSKTE